MGLGQCPPKSDTNPLTLPEHPCYYTHRSNTHPNYLKEEPQPRGKPIPGPRGLNVQAHPKGRPTRRPSAQANDAISSYQRPRLTFPRNPGDGMSTDYARQAPSNDASADSTLPIIGCVYPGPLRAGFPGRSTDPRFSKALVSLFVPPSLPPVYPADAPGRRF